MPISLFRNFTPAAMEASMKFLPAVMESWIHWPGLPPKMLSTPLAAPPAHWSGGYRCRCARSAYPESRSLAPAYPFGCRIPSALRHCNGGRSPLPAAIDAALPTNSSPATVTRTSSLSMRIRFRLSRKVVSAKSGRAEPASRIRSFSFRRYTSSRSMSLSDAPSTIFAEKSGLSAGGQGITYRLPGSRALSRSPAACNRCRRWWQHENWISPPIPPAPRRQRFPPARFR